MSFKKDTTYWPILMSLKCWKSKEHQTSWWIKCKNSTALHIPWISSQFSKMTAFIKSFCIIMLKERFGGVAGFIIYLILGDISTEYRPHFESTLVQMNRFILLLFRGQLRVLVGHSYSELKPSLPLPDWMRSSWWNNFSHWEGKKP